MDILSAYRVDGWLINPKKNEVIKDGEVIRIETKAMQVLNFLADRAGTVVSRKELMEHVWSDVYVSEETLSRCISILRKTFGDSATASDIIQTIKGEGYRIIAAVEFMEPDPGFNRSKAAKISASYKKGVVILSILLLVSVTLVVVLYQQNNNSPYNWTKVPVATSKFDEMYPVISPDGSRIAYSCYTNAQTNSDIFVKVSNGSEKAIKITDFAGNETCPVWSPDGRYIAYNKQDGEDHGIYKISALGGAPQKIGTPFETVPQQMAWSYDGKFIAYSDRASPEDSFSIYLLEIATGEKSKLTSPTFQHWGDYSPSFSPNDEKLSFIRAVSAGTHDLFVYDFKSEKSERLTFQTRRTSGQTWSADKNYIIYAHEEGKNGALWRIPSEGGKPTPLNISGIRPSIDRSGQHLVVEDWNYDYDIYTIDLLDSPAKVAVPEVNSTYEDFDPENSPDGNRMVFISNRSGSYELWLYNRLKKEVSRLTHFNGTSYLNYPSWSNDGTRIAFTLFTPEGNADIYILNVNSGSVIKRLNSEFNEISPVWNADDTGIFYGSNISGEWQIWYHDITSKLSRQITGSGGYSPVFSERTNKIYYSRFDKKGVWKVSMNDTTAIQVVNDLHLSDWANFDTDENGGIYYISRQSILSPTYLNYSDSTHLVAKTILESGFSKNTRIRLSNNSVLLGTQRTDLDVDVLLYKLKLP